MYICVCLFSVAVVVAFFICWAPFHAQRLVAIYGNSLQAAPPYQLKVYEIVTYVSGVLYYVSTTVNPVLYHIMSNKFREAFKVSEALLRYSLRKKRVPSSCKYLTGIRSTLRIITVKDKCYIVPCLQTKHYKLFRYTSGVLTQKKTMISLLIRVSIDIFLLNNTIEYCPDFYTTLLRIYFNK